MILFSPLKKALLLMESQGREWPDGLAEVYQLYQQVLLESNGKAFPFQKEVEAYVAGHLYVHLRIPFNPIIDEPTPGNKSSQPKKTERKKKEPDVDSEWLKQMEEEAQLLKQLQQKK